MPKPPILRSDLFRLYENLKNLLAAEGGIDVKHRSYIEILGTKKKAKDDYPSIRTMLTEKKLASEEDSYTHVRYFYTKLNQLNQQKVLPGVKIMDKGLDVFATLIDAGYETLSDFLKGPSKGDKSSKGYLCFYYSTKSEVRDFPLTLKKDENGDISAIAGKYHDCADSIRLTGPLKLIGNCLNIYLENPEVDKQYFLNFSLHAENYKDAQTRSFPPSKFLQGILTANSSYQGGYPITMECVLIDDSVTESEKKNVLRYLNLRNNSFHVIADPERQESTDQLKINNKKIESFGKLAKAHYRIWRYGESPRKTKNKRKERVLFQSCMSVDDYCNSKIEVPLFPDDLGVRTEKHHCRIIPNTLHTTRIFILVYRENALTTFTISNIPTGTQHEIIQGAYCIETRPGETVPTSGYFVMMKDEPECEVKIMSMSELEQEIGTKQHLKEMKEKLDSCPSF